MGKVAASACSEGAEAIPRPQIVDTAGVEVIPSISFLGAFLLLHSLNPPPMLE